MKTHSKVLDTPEVVAWTGAFIAVVLHFSGVAVLSPEILGSTLTMVAWPVVMVVLRVVNKYIDSSATNVSILFLCLFFGGCIQHVCKDDVVVSIKPSAPSKVSARCASDSDAKVTLVGSGAATLRVKCPEGTSIGTRPGTQDVLDCVGD